MGIQRAVPPVLTGCQHCAYKIKNESQAVEILHDLVRTAHLTSIKGGGTLITARIDIDLTVKLCLWGVECEECEHHEDYGDSAEPESQGAGGVNNAQHANLLHVKRLKRKQTSPRGGF